MKKNIVWSGLAVLVAVAMFIGSVQTVQASALADDSVTPFCTALGDSVRQMVGGGRGFGNGNGNANAGATTPAQAQSGTGLALPATGDLSQAEADALTFMVEEEKLARDVYAFLYQTWGAATFSSISASEQSHMDSIKTLLAAYGLQDPDSGVAGVFTNPDLQALYNQLTAQGSASLADAYKVGGAIEEIDILDLEKRLAETDNADIQLVFNNLLSGSYNHLRAFATALYNQTGETYAPQYLSADAYAAILASSTGNGGVNGQGQQGQGQRGMGGSRGGRP